MCPGHPEAHFLEMVEAKKGYLRSHTGDTVALADNYTSVQFNDKVNVNCLCMVESVHHARSTCTVLNSDHSILSGELKRKRRSVFFTNDQHLKAL